ncbi:hypothetical protein LTR70_001919 [Exophiala xenobiotica]|uniref:Importin N-terminal domain-containing protein n=1 Tax=Lithohypha guttulata TaxID=1690604 RepID=A0ABR0K9C2_9EURO|nr:hypothetical protein LTR24_005409 [Lithohypha guttulata]KAK5326904.1 hypothetical protein LTR70_001919 [Exophiala xenobiotica]
MPSFAIEAEGETVPLSVKDIFQTLAQTAGAQATQQSLQVSAKQLANWEKTPGYYSLLQEVYADFSLDDGIRLQAIIQLKNGIDKHWRKTSQHPVKKPEKEKIRAKAIQVGVQEPKRNLALQNALMLAKIVRFEFPHDWPDVISTLIRHLRDASANDARPEYVSNILNITLQVIKELASGKLIRTKKSLQSVAPELLHVLGQLYITLVERWTGARILDEQSMLNSHSALKTLRRLVIFGFEHPHREESVKQLWQVVQSHCDLFFSMWKQNQDNTLLPKHLYQINKIWLEMSRQHPASFVLLGCMDILRRSWEVVNDNNAKEALTTGLDWSVHSNGDVGVDESPIEKLALRALLLFRACIKMVFNPVHTFKYQYPEDKEDRKNAVDQVKSQVFTHDFVVQLMEILVTQYFVLRPADLRDWEQEPDEWERREEEIADAWEFSIRSCSEKLFLDLVINFKELLVPRLLQVFQQYAKVDNHEVLLKDSLYSAIGIAAACVEDVLDFNGFIRNTLVPEVQMNQPNYNLLRRRASIVLGQWVPIKPEQLDRVAIYQIFAHLLSSSEQLNDHVVRVTAGRQLKLILEPFEFSYPDFQPYATPILEHLMGLIQETELSETKMALLETVRVAVTKLEGQIEPYAQGIMSILPALWAESGEEHLMKQAILTMITAIIQSLGKKGASYHEPIYPLIHDSVQPESEASVYLLEEALELWAALMAQAPSEQPSQQLLAMSKSLLPLLELGSEHLRQCFEILESYVILSPTTILDAQVLTPLLASQKSMLSMLNTSRARDASLSPRVLQTIIQSLSVPGNFTAEAREAALEHVVTTMIQTGYLPSLLAILHEAYSYHQDPRPNRRPPDIMGVGETSLFTLLSHLVLANPALFVSALNSLPATEAEKANLSWLLNEWFYQYDSTPDTLRRKTQLLALTSLLSLSPPPTPLLASLQSLFSVYADTLTELGEGAADENRGDYLYSPAPAGEMLQHWPGSDSPEDVRKRHMTNWDVVYVVNARNFVAEKLRQTVEACGGQQAFEQQWITGTIDQDVLRSFANLGIL